MSLDELTELPFYKAMYEFQKYYWAALIERHRGNFTHVARAAEVRRTSVYKLMHRVRAELPARTSPHPLKERASRT
jgi:DNA-binding NtrC family response regulator